MLIILGVTGGLGAGLVEYFRSSESALAPYGSLRATNRAELDLTDADQVAAFCASLGEQLAEGESLHVINATGVSINALHQRASLDDFQTTLQVNTTGSFLLSRELYPVFKQHPGSSLLLFSSVVAEIGVAGTSAYAASKGALAGFVRSTARELARINCRINTLELGYFSAGMITQLSPVALQAVIDQIPIGRLGTIEDLFLACDFALRCGFVTGASIKVNGGMT